MKLNIVLPFALLRDERLDLRGLERPGTYLPLEKDVQLSVSAGLGLGESEESPHNAQTADPSPR